MSITNSDEAGPAPRARQHSLAALLRQLSILRARRRRREWAKKA